LDHIRFALELRDRGTPEVGRPTDLRQTCAQIGLHGPANVAWRALARQLTPGHEVTAAGLWRAAATIGNGFRTLFNRPESIALLDRETSEPAYWRAVLRYCANGNLQAVLDEYVHHLVAGRSAAVLDDEALLDVATEIRAAVGLRPSIYQAFDPEHPNRPIRLPSRFALRYGSKRQTEEDARLPEVRRAFNSPFWPFVLATTSVGQEGIDLHWWCSAVVHWNTPANPVDFEQREGRVHRYGGHAIRRNLAFHHGTQVLASPGRNPWATAYRLAEGARPDLGELAPCWVYPGAAAIERHVAPYPLSSDQTKLDRIKTDVALYRFTFGQPRQEDLLAFLRRHGAGDAEAEHLRIDLRPPPASTLLVDEPVAEVAEADLVEILESLADRAPVASETGNGAGRLLWQESWAPAVMELVDRMAALINDVDPAARLSFQAGYAGIQRNGVAANYLIVEPRKDHLVLRLRIPESSELTERIRSGGLDLMSYVRWGAYGVRVRARDLTDRHELLQDLVRRSMDWLGD
jgi:hypothetical protein